MTSQLSSPPDTLNSVGVLKRREIEARILIPLIEALGKEFGRERVLAIVRETIIQIARGQGAALAQNYGNTVNDFSGSLENWKKDNALEIETVEQSDDKLYFNVTRCRYAEMYRALGIPELGAILSCNRDASLIEGFNENITFARTQTIMNGAACCDFRYDLKK